MKLKYTPDILSVFSQMQVFTRFVLKTLLKMHTPEKKKSDDYEM